jgi:hypothetical protein
MSVNYAQNKFTMVSIVSFLFNYSDCVKKHPIEFSFEKYSPTEQREITKYIKSKLSIARPDNPFSDLDDATENRTVLDTLSSSSSRDYLRLSEERDRTPVIESNNHKRALSPNPNANIRDVLQAHKNKVKRSEALSNTKNKRMSYPPKRKITSARKK